MVRRVADGLEVEPPRRFPAHDDRERVVEPERFRQFDAELRGVRLARLPVNLARVVDRLALEDRGEGRARVLDVHVDAARNQRLVAQERPAQIELAVDREPGALDLLRHQLSQDALLGEVLRADYDRGAVPAAGREREEQQGEGCEQAGADPHHPKIPASGIRSSGRSGVESVSPASVDSSDTRT